jgi:hypothetical protein
MLAFKSPFPLKANKKHNKLVKVLTEYNSVRYYVHIIILNKNYMEIIHTQNFRFQIWFNAMPDKILLGIVSICAENEESARLLIKHYTDYRLVGTDNINWQIKEPMAIYKY